MITEKWTKKDLVILEREGFKKDKEDGYTKKVGVITYKVYRWKLSTADWVKYLRVISNHSNGYYDGRVMASLYDLFYEIKRDSEVDENLDIDGNKWIDLTGKIITIEGVSYRLGKV